RSAGPRRPRLALALLSVGRRARAPAVSEAPPVTGAQQVKRARRAQRVQRTRAWAERTVRGVQAAATRAVGRPRRLARGAPARSLAWPGKLARPLNRFAAVRARRSRSVGVFVEKALPAAHA